MKQTSLEISAPCLALMVNQVESHIVERAMQLCREYNELNKD